MISLSLRRLGIVGRIVTRPSGAVGVALVLMVGAVAGLADHLAPGDPFALRDPALLAPSAAHLLGTDNLGRDLLSAVIHGIRTSITVCVAVTVVSSAIGLTVGITAGVAGGLVEAVLMRLTDVVQSIPRFFLAILALSLLGRTLENLILVLGLTSWTLLARVVRAEALSIRRMDFVEASRSYGGSNTRIARRHVLPNVVPSALVITALNASQVILLEASLAFLGLGDQSKMSLGFLINNAQPFLQQAWWMSLFPGAAIAVSVLGLNLVADALNDVLNPLTQRAFRDVLRHPRWMPPLNAAAPTVP